LAFLNGPFGGEERLAEFDEFGDRKFEFFAILKVAGDGDFLSDEVPGFGTILRGDDGRHEHDCHKKGCYNGGFETRVKRWHFHIQFPLWFSVPRVMRDSSR
jgi:hypothetical protein